MSEEAFAWIEGPAGELIAVVGDVEVQPGFILGPQQLLPALGVWLPPEVDLGARPGDVLNVILKEEGL